MILDEIRTMVQTPHPDLHYALWSQLDDSSPIGVSITQTAHSVTGLHILAQIGQIGITTTIIALAILVVMVDGLYRELEDDTYPKFGHRE